MERFLEVAAEHGGRCAIAETGRRVTFAALDELSARGATLLRRCGLAPGDRVLVMEPMSADLYGVLLAVFRAGLVAMFVDPGAGRRHLEACLRRFPPRAYLGGPLAQWLRAVSPEIRRIPVKIALRWPSPGAVSWRRLWRVPAQPGVAARAPEDPAVLTFTSGSTGRPKAALRTQGFLLAQHRVLAESLSLAPGGIDLCTLPVFGLANLASGVTTVIPDADLRRPGFIDPAPVVSQIRELRPAQTAASPAFLTRLATHCVKEGTTLESFERIFVGGAPVFPAQLRLIQAMAPQARVTVVYGSTEAEPMCDMPFADQTPQDYERILLGGGLPVGRPVREIGLRVIGDTWGRPIGALSEDDLGMRTVAPGEPGEIVVAGDHVLGGYADGDGDAETKFSAGGRVWHRTGDAGYLDAAGRLWLLGRCAAVIQDRRGILHPYTVEAPAMEVRGVRRAALAAANGKRVLLVELDPPGSALPVEDLRRIRALGDLDEVRVVHGIPVDRRHNAKIDYPALRDVLARS